MSGRVAPHSKCPHCRTENFLRLSLWLKDLTTPSQQAWFSMPLFPQVRTLRPHVSSIGNDGSVEEGAHSYETWSLHRVVGAPHPLSRDYEIILYA
jgi:hypothetical protein